MTAFLQLLGVVLAMVATGTLAMSAFFLGVDARGWRDAPVWLRQVLHVAAIFWLVAAMVAMVSPRAVIGAVTIGFAALFALGGFAVLAWVLRHRPARVDRRIER